MVVAEDEEEDGEEEGRSAFKRILYWYNWMQSPSKIPPDVLFYTWISMSMMARQHWCKGCFAISGENMPLA